MVKDLRVDDTGAVTFSFLLTREDPATLVRETRKTVQAVPGVTNVTIKIASPRGTRKRPSMRTTGLRISATVLAIIRISSTAPEARASAHSPSSECRPTAARCALPDVAATLAWLERALERRR